MSQAVDPEEKIICPYNNSHHIRRCRMSFHLVKCKQNHGEQRMVPCDFNATHMIPEVEIRYHHTICSDRKKLEPRIVESQMKSTQERYPIKKLDVESEENWDDFNCATYDPIANAETKDVLRQRDVWSESKRRNFRMTERKRLGEMNRSNVRPEPPVQPQASAVRLPPHRAATSVADERFDSSALKQKLRMETNKVFLQHDSQDRSK